MIEKKSFFSYKERFYRRRSCVDIGVIGLNHKMACLKLREKIAKACHSYFGVHAIPFDGRFPVLLSTCNRTEIYFSSENLANTHIQILNRLRQHVHEQQDCFDQKLYSYFGKDCFHHLARVTSGLDSAVIGETEIQGQVKAAYERAIESTPRLAPELHYLFQKSLKIGKTIRSTFDLGYHTLDMEHAVLKLGQHHFGSCEKLKILFIGASDINLKIIQFMKSRQFDRVTVCNRTKDRLMEFSRTHSLNALEWDFRDHWGEYDWIIFGTKAPDYLMTQGQVRSWETDQSPKLIIDLCVPRNVDPLVVQKEGIFLYNIDQINASLASRSDIMSQLVEEAEKYVSISTLNHIALFKSKERYRNRTVAFTA